MFNNLHKWVWSFDYRKLAIGIWLHVVCRCWKSTIKLKICHVFNVELKVGFNHYLIACKTIPRMQTRFDSFYHWVTILIIMSELCDIYYTWWNKKVCVKMIISNKISISNSDELCDIYNTWWNEKAFVEMIIWIRF